MPRPLALNHTSTHEQITDTQLPSNAIYSLGIDGPALDIVGLSCSWEGRPLRADGLGLWACSALRCVATVEARVLVSPNRDDDNGRGNGEFTGNIGSWKVNWKDDLQRQSDRLNSTWA